MRTAIILLIITIGYAIWFDHQLKEIKSLKAANEMLTNEKASMENVLSLIFQEKFELARLKIDEVTVSAYFSEKKQCDNDPHITSTGKVVSPGCASLSRDLPPDKRKSFLLTGIGVFRNEDTMHKRKAKQVDLWIPDKIAAKEFGIKKAQIMWLDSK